MYMLPLSFLWMNFITMRTMFSTFVVEFLRIIFFFFLFLYSHQTGLWRKRWCHFFVVFFFSFLFSAANQNLHRPDNVLQRSSPCEGVLSLLFSSWHKQNTSQRALMYLWSQFHHLCRQICFLHIHHLIKSNVQIFESRLSCVLCTREHIRTRVVWAVCGLPVSDSRGTQETN